MFLRQGQKISILPDSWKIPVLKTLCIHALPWTKQSCSEEGRWRWFPVTRGQEHPPLSSCFLPHSCLGQVGRSDWAGFASSLRTRGGEMKEELGVPCRETQIQSASWPNQVREPDGRPSLACHSLVFYAHPPLLCPSLAQHCGIWDPGPLSSLHEAELISENRPVCIKERNGKASHGHVPSPQPPLLPRPPSSSQKTDHHKKLTAYDRAIPV